MIITRMRYFKGTAIRSWLVCTLLHLASVFDALVFFLTLGFYEGELHAYLLFNTDLPDWAEGDMYEG
jgi:hypothetical protein